MEAYESELSGKVEDIGRSMSKCDGKGRGIDAIRRLGEVRKDRVNLSGKGRAFRSISMLAFP
jgi:hypothetical protein